VRHGQPHRGEQQRRLRAAWQACSVPWRRQETNPRAILPLLESATCWAGCSGAGRLPGTLRRGKDRRVRMIRGVLRLVTV
jgi:hypothetical protein